MDLSQFVQLAERFESWLDIEIARLSIDQVSMSENAPSDHEDLVAEELYLHDTAFPPIGRSALHIVTMAYAERHMNALCRVIQAYTASPTSFRDLKGAGLPRACEYLKSLRRSGELSAFNSKEWQDLTAHSLIRNKTVHGGLLSCKDLRKVERLEKSGVISITEASHGQFTFHFRCQAIAKLVASMQEFFRRLHIDAKTVFD